MTAKTGSSSNIVVAKGSTYGTAVSGGAGSKILVESLNHGRNADQLTSAPIGSGLDMLDDSELGTIKPSVNIQAVDKFDGSGNLLQALFFQGASVTAGASSTYTHSFVYNATRNGYFGTVAFDAAVGSVFEYASCTPTKVGFTVEPDNYTKLSVDLIADKQTIASTTNTPASLAAATASTTKKVVARSSDKFRINAQAGGALADGDVVAIKSAEITYSYSAEAANEIRNATGLGQPVATGNPPFTAEIKVVLRNNSDLTWFTAAQAGTEYKADLTITSSYYAGGAVNYKKIFNFPRLKLMSDPDWNLSQAGDNPVTLTFSALVASANPTGMINTYPYILVTNATAAAYL